MKHRLKLHKVLVQSLSFSFDEQYLASLGGQDDNTLVIWDVSKNNQIIMSNFRIILLNFYFTNIDWEWQGTHWKSSWHEHCQQGCFLQHHFIKVLNYSQLWNQDLGLWFGSKEGQILRDSHGLNQKSLHVRRHWPNRLIRLHRYQNRGHCWDLFGSQLVQENWTNQKAILSRCQYNPTSFKLRPSPWCWRWNHC